MTIIKLPNIVLPLQHLDKTNEIIQVLNDNLNMNYSESNPALTSVEDVCTWTVTHNLGTENVNYSVYEGSNSIITNVSVVSENVIEVTFNSNTNIAKDTYTIVVMANGSGSSSGGSIVTVDSELSTTSTNPVQNRIITNYVKPKLDNYISGGTVISVKTDGTGHFTDIESALNSLIGKWSNGMITIQIGEGTYTLNHSLTLGYYNIPIVRISGVNKDSVIIEQTAATSVFEMVVNKGTVEFENLSLKGSTTSAGAGIDVMQGYARINNVICDKFWAGIYGDWNSNTLTTNATLKNCGSGIMANSGSNIVLNGTFSFFSCTTGLTVSNASIIRIFGATGTFTNVTNRMSQSSNSITNNGMIIGSM